MRQSKGRKFESFRRAQVRLRGTISRLSLPSSACVTRQHQLCTLLARSSLISRLLVLVLPHKLRSETAWIGASLCSA